MARASREPCAYEARFDGCHSFPLFRAGCRFLAGAVTGHVGRSIVRAVPGPGLAGSPGWPGPRAGRAPGLARPPGWPGGTMVHGWGLPESEPQRALLPCLPRLPPGYHLTCLRPPAQRHRCHNDAHLTTWLSQRRRYPHPAGSRRRSAPSTEPHPWSIVPGRGAARQPGSRSDRPGAAMAGSRSLTGAGEQPIPAAERSERVTGLDRQTPHGAGQTVVGFIQDRAFGQGATPIESGARFPGPTWMVSSRRVSSPPGRTGRP